MNSKKHKHYLAGKSSRDIISASKVFDLLNLPQGIVFLDAGCGDEADITKKNLPLEDENVDVYFMSNVLHGFDEEEKQKVIEEAKRVLKKKKKRKIVVIEFKKRNYLYWSTY